MSNELQDILSMQEGQFYERKSARIQPDDLVKEIVGFANASGGLIAIGIENNGEVTGFQTLGAKSIDSFIEAPSLLLRNSPVRAKFRRIPAINSMGSRDEILVIDVDPSVNHVVVCNNGEAYLRINDKNIRFSYEQRRNLEFDKGQRFFEDEVVRGSSFDDVDLDLLTEYQNKLGVQVSTPVEILEARRFLIDGHLTNAGVLLFAKNPTKYLPNARLRFLRYEGKESMTGQSFNVVKEITIEEPLHRMIQTARDVVRSQLRDFQYLDAKTGMFSIMPEYPEFAWFEGIVNALTHRDYSIRGDHVRVSMFDNRLEIFSPGKLPNIVTLQNMQYTRYSRNPRIAKVLLEFGWVKELNEGVKRIYLEMEQAFLNSPTYSEPNSNAVLLVLENNILNRVVRLTDQLQERLTEEVFTNLHEDERIVLQIAFMTGKVTVKDISIKIGRSKYYTSSLLKKLTEKGFLIWHGTSATDPTQYYTFAK